MQFTKIGVVGAGTMGHGIAEVAAGAGYEVFVREASQQALERGLARIEASVERRAAKGKLSESDARALLERVHGTVEYADLAGCELVIEAVDEDLETKLEVWRAIDPLLSERAICATNTSSLSVIDQAAVTTRAERFVGLHFFNPPQVMTLLEVVRTVLTTRETLRAVTELGARLGKDVVNAPDRSGFIVNRLLLPYTMDAIRTLESGYGTIADIDMAMRKGTGYPMGPFTLLDYVGLDISLAIAEAMFDEYREARFAAPSTLRKLVAAGRLGRKSGRGFYDYSGETPAPADLGLFPTDMPAPEAPGA